jgi:hypothetical protein
MKGCTTLFIFFRTCNFCTANPAADADFDPLTTCAHRALNSAFDRTTEVDPRFDLFGNLFADDIGV